MDKLKMTVLAVIGGVVLLLALIFTGILPGLQGAEDKAANLVLWGFEDPKAWETIFKDYGKARSNVKIQYIKKDIVSFENDLVSTLARGETPDIVVFPSQYMQKQADKLSLAPAVVMTQRQLQENQIDAAASFWYAPRQMAIGIPLYGDALVLYSNKSILTKHFIAGPPKTWDDFLDYSQKITDIDRAGNILTAGAALGRSANIIHASDVLTALFLQFGEPIIENGLVVLGSGVSRGAIQTVPTVSALQFFSDFANPKKASFNWSTVLPEAKDLFVAERLGFYIGYMSEYDEIVAKNPHLELNISLLPQLADAPRPVTYGTLYALVVPRNTKNYAQSWAFISYLTSPAAGAKFAALLKTVFPQRGTLPTYQGGAVSSVFANSMLALKLWPNPDPSQTKRIFNTLIENMALNRGTPDQLINDARIQLDRLVPNQP